MHLQGIILSLQLPIYFGGSVSNPMFFLYLGPQTVLPIASILAGIVGVVLIFWRLILRFIKKIFNIQSKKPSVESDTRLEPIAPTTDPKDGKHD